MVHRLDRLIAIWGHSIKRGFVMTKRKLVAALAAVAMIGSGTTPAFASGWGGGTSISAGFGFGSGYRGYGRRHRHWRRGNGVSAGDVIAGVAIVGVIAAIASSASKRKAERDGSTRFSRIRSENEAVDACAIAAERKAGETASVRDITQVDPVAGGWDVEGEIERRADWRDETGDRSRFTCSVRSGMVDHVYLDRDDFAAR